jgi:hypothetical protein
MPYTCTVFSFIETRLFSRLIREYLSDEDYGRLQLELVENPEAGAVVRGSGGVRKLRWAAAGHGKRGGCRVVYFVRRQQGVIWMLTIYAKNVVDSIPGHVLKEISREIEND